VYVNDILITKKHKNRPQCVR